MVQKDNLSEIVRTAAGYELFLRLTSDRTSLMEAAFQREVKHFLSCSFRGRRGKRHESGEVQQTNTGEA